MSKQNILTRGKKKQALALFKSNKLEKARNLFINICKRDKSDFESHFMLGTINAKLGLFSEAEKNFQSTIKIRSNFYQAYDSLAAVLFEQGKKQDSIEFFKRSISIEPEFYSSHYNLGNALKETGLYTEAMKSYKNALKLKPNLPDAHNNIGTIHLQRNEYKKAVDCFNKSIQMNPNEARSYINLSKSLTHLGKLKEACNAVKKSLQLDPNYAQAHFELGKLYSLLGYDEKSEACLRKALNIDPQYIEAHNMLGSSLLVQAKLEEAKLCFEHIRNINPESINSIEGFASIEIKKGNYDKAYKHLKTVVNSNRSSVHTSFLLASISKHTNKQEEAATQMEQLLSNENIVNIDEIRHLHYGLGNLYDDTENHEKAFYNYQKANELQPYTFEQTKLVDATDELIKTVNRHLIKNTPHANNKESPIFIVGMMRSGTSLIEQIISSHHRIYGAGELETISEIVSSLNTNPINDTSYPHCIKHFDKTVINKISQKYIDKISSITSGEEFITDKMPHNYWHLGLIELLFPNSKIIICSRDPLDTCLSGYFQDFGSRHEYSNNLEHLGEYYIQYTRLINHWKNTLSIPILDVQYEELVCNQEEVIRRIIDFCGVEWDEKCLNFYKNNRIVKTASSDQVKQPMHNKSIGRWRHYKKHLTPLINILKQRNLH